MPMPEDKIILFVCTGNTCRSPMAAALLASLCPAKKQVILSAGLAAQTGLSATSGAVAAMQAYGIDLTGHRSQPVVEELLLRSELVLAMTGWHKQLLQEAAPELAEKIMTLAEAAGQPELDVADPYGQSDAAYQETARVIKHLLQDYLARSGDNIGCRPKT